MRLLHDARAEIDAKGDMKRLAMNFPGALREIDRLPLEEIRSRIVALDAAIDANAPTPDWATYACAYHGWMRALLALRSQIGDEHDPARALQKMRARYQEQFERETEFDFDEVSLPEVLKLDGGRMNPWVFERIAREYGVTPERVEASIFTALTSSF